MEHCLKMGSDPVTLLSITEMQSVEIRWQTLID